ncbi:MAG TPA: hypothetical protein VFK13_07035 [Gemmatimonadaceae bacterium]|nr:hypothetical protein [Gemmatimonadaceae bacterium]
MAVPASGIIVLDNSALPYLTDAAVQRRVFADARAADWEIALTHLNAVEAAKTPTKWKRDRLFAVIGALTPSDGLWPDPLAVLRVVGQAIHDGRASVRLKRLSLDEPWLNPEAYDRLHTECEGLASLVERRFANGHAAARPQIQARLRQLDSWPYESSAANFLDQYLGTEGLVRTVADVTWRGLKLPGQAPLERLLRHPVWRLYLDVEGYAIYARGIVHIQPKQAGRLDLLQLVYAGLRPRSLIVTADTGMLLAAHAILEGRYPGARVVEARVFAAPNTSSTEARP